MFFHGQRQKILKKMNCIRRFLFENLNIQGAWVHLESGFEAVLHKRNYPDSAAKILGEMLVATLYLAQMLKTQARLSLQLKAQAPISQVFVDVKKTAETGEDLLFRAMAKPADCSKPQEIVAGQNGILLMNLELPESQKPYQSAVALKGNSIGAIFENFICQSEQTDIFIKLATSQNFAGGLFLKKLPDADLKDKDGFVRLKILAETATDSELLNDDFAHLMTKIFAEDSKSLRIFAPQNVRYHCPYDPQKILNILKTMPPENLAQMLDENGKIHVHDDICNFDYFFDFPRST